jgi:hypothetical protein
VRHMDGDCQAAHQLAFLAHDTDSKQTWPSHGKTVEVTREKAWNLTGYSPSFASQPVFDTS